MYSTMNSLDFSRIHIPTYIMRSWSHNVASPRYVHYDKNFDSRIELSGTTLLNWVSKTAHFLRLELMIDDGTPIQCALKDHWQSTAALLGIVCAGATLAEEADIVFAGADNYHDFVDSQELVVLPYDPFCMQSLEIPEWAHHFGHSIRPHADVYSLSLVSSLQPHSPVLQGMSHQQVLENSYERARNHDLLGQTVGISQITPLHSGDNDVLLERFFTPTLHSSRQVCIQDHDHDTAHHLFSQEHTHTYISSSPH